MVDRDVAVRFGGLSLLMFIPLLVAGAVLFSRIGLSSRSEGADALQRIADAGVLFPVMNAFFHLGPLLLLPGGVAMALTLRGADREAWIVLGLLCLVLAVVVSAGFVFPLNHGLYGMAIPFRDGPADARSWYATAAGVNLQTQAGAELVQSLGIGAWVLCMSAAMGAAGWPMWFAWVGLAGGLGFISAGLSSVLLDVPALGSALAAAGALGLLVFAVWLIATSVRLMTIAVQA